MTDHPAARLLSVLGDPVRMRLLRELPAEDAAEIPVRDMARRIGVTDSALSQHLRVLAGLHLVRARRQGREARYFVDAAALAAGRRLLAEALPALFPAAAGERMISARNQLWGRVVEVHRGPVSTEVAIDIGGQVVTAQVTTRSAERLGLAEGTIAAALFKAGDVTVMV